MDFENIEDSADLENYWIELLDAPLPENLCIINEEILKFINKEINIFELCHVIYMALLRHIRETAERDVAVWSGDLKDDIIIVVTRTVENAIGDNITHFFNNRNRPNLDICLFYCSQWFDNKLEDDDKIFIRDEFLNSNWGDRKPGMNFLLETISAYIFLDNEEGWVN